MEGNDSVSSEASFTLIECNVKKNFYNLLLINNKYLKIILSQCFLAFCKRQNRQCLGIIFSLPNLSAGMVSWYRIARMGMAWQEAWPENLSCALNRGRAETALPE